jgi:hypothetical protein
VEEEEEDAEVTAAEVTTRSLSYQIFTDFLRKKLAFEQYYDPLFVEFSSVFE